MDPAETGLAGYRRRLTRGRGNLVCDRWRRRKEKEKISPTADGIAGGKLPGTLTLIFDLSLPRPVTEASSFPRRWLGWVFYCFGEGRGGRREGF
ncbi:unnamed protein product [Victoria cruziana]